MNKHNILFGGLGLLAGFIIGFFLANSFGYHTPVSVNTQTRPATPAPPTPATAAAAAPSAADADDGALDSLTEDEVRGAIAAADGKPENIELQHKLGLYLYRYASYKQDARYLPDVERFLKRAFEATPNDRDLAVALGNVLFDTAQSGDASRFKEARLYYQKALEMKADDVNVRTDLGLTYYFAKPSEPEKAIAEYRKSLAIDARHELTLQHLATALIATKKLEEAQKRIDELQAINPSNPALSNLRAQLAQAKNAQE